MKTLDALLSKVKVAAGAALLATTIACGGSGGPGPTGPTPTTQTTTIEFYNHEDMAKLGTQKYTGTGTLTINLNSLASTGGNTNSISKKYIVARSPPQGGKIGTYITRTENGQLQIPYQDATIRVIFFGTNIANEQQLNCAYNTAIAGQNNLPFGRYTDIGELKPGDHITGFPTGTTIVQGSDQDFQTMQTGLQIINDALRDAEGTQLGSLNLNRNNTTAPIKGGFANIPGPNNGAYGGYHNGMGQFLVRPTPTSPRSVKIVTSAEAFEEWLGYDDLCGNDTVNSLYTPNPNPNQNETPTLKPSAVSQIRFLANMSSK